MVEPSSVHVLPVVPTTAPAKFDAWDASIRARCYALWASLAGRSAPRTVALLTAEMPEGSAAPSAPTVRRWASEGQWGNRADGEAWETRGKTMAHLREGWLMTLVLAQSALLDSLSGALDDLPPAVVAARLKACELALRVAERASLITFPLESEGVPSDSGESLSLTQRARRQRARMYERNAGG